MRLQSRSRCTSRGTSGTLASRHALLRLSALRCVITSIRSELPLNHLHLCGLQGSICTNIAGSAGFRGVPGLPPGNDPLVKWVLPSQIAKVWSASESKPVNFGGQSLERGDQVIIDLGPDVTGIGSELMW